MKVTGMKSAMQGDKQHGITPSQITDASHEHLKALFTNVTRKRMKDIKDNIGYQVIVLSLKTQKVSSQKRQNLHWKMICILVVGSALPHQCYIGLK